jgi:hypothetical protein
VLGCVRLPDIGGLTVPSPREVRGEGALASRIRSRGLTQFVRARPHFVRNFRACDATAAAVLPSTTSFRSHCEFVAIEQKELRHP